MKIIEKKLKVNCTKYTLLEALNDTQFKVGVFYKVVESDWYYCERGEILLTIKINQNCAHGLLSMSDQAVLTQECIEKEANSNIRVILMPKGFQLTLEQE